MLRESGLPNWIGLSDSKYEVEIKIQFNDNLDFDDKIRFQLNEDVD